ncbi:hypothetical protein DFH28DRAFT_977727, partial [Melampsora americana]
KQFVRLFTTSASIEPNHQKELESNLTSCANSSIKPSKEFKRTQTDQLTLMSPLTYILPTLGTFSNQPTHSNQTTDQSITSPQTLHIPPKTPLPIKTQIPEPALVQRNDHPSTSNHPSSSSDQTHALSNRIIHSNYLSNSLPTLHDPQRSRSTPLEIDSNYECGCKALKSSSISTFKRTSISLNENEIYEEEDQDHPLRNEDILMSTEDLHSLNSCQVFPARSNSSDSIDRSINLMNDLMMMKKKKKKDCKKMNEVDERMEEEEEEEEDDDDDDNDDNVSLESNEFYRGRTKSRPTTILDP